MPTDQTSAGGGWEPTGQAPGQLDFPLWGGGIESSWSSPVHPWPWECLDPTGPPDPPSMPGQPVPTANSSTYWTGSGNGMVQGLWEVRLNSLGSLALVFIFDRRS